MIEESITTTILGQRETGKTTYLMTLYNRMKAGVTVDGSQLTLAMPTGKVEDDNFFSRQYKSLKEKSMWPTATPAAEVKDYQLYFVKDLSERFSFSWVDYSGELFEEQSHLMPEAYKTVTDRLKKESTSVLFPLKGKLFAQPIPTDEEELADFKNKHGYDVFNGLMGKYIIERNKHGRPPIIVLLITMCDLCKERDFEEIVADIQSLFPALFNRKCITGIIPVSLGSGPKDHFTVRPYQVHLPLLFILHQELEINLKLAELVKEYESGNIQVEKNSFWGKLLDELGLNQTVDNARKRLKKVEKYKNFFSPYHQMFQNALMKGKLVYFDDVRHDIGSDKKLCNF